MSLLADHLHADGHEIHWWSTTFDHHRKCHRFEADQRIEIRPGFTLHLLHGPGYPRNVTLARVRHHRHLARRFRAAIGSERAPALIISSIPPPDLAAAAVGAARALGAISVVDVRDLWPDIILDLAPAVVRPMARMALKPMYRAARYALHAADARIGVSDAYLNWAVRLGGRGADARDRVYPLGYPRLEIPDSGRAEAGVRMRERGVDPHKRIAWFVGVFGRSYDLSTVIAAARDLAAAGRHDIQFVLSGSGDFEAQWRAEAAGLSNVVFTGRIGTAEIAYLMEIAALGLAAYATGAPQGLPNKLFEYMSAGLPTLSSLGAEAAQLLGEFDCGVSYRPGDAVDLAAKLTRILDNPQLHDRMARNAAATFAARFDAERIYATMARHVVSLAR